MIVIVAGGRDFNQRRVIFSTLDALYQAAGLTEIVHGGASGADTLAGEWARGEGVPQVVYKADWDKHGKAAGPMRNRAMAQHGIDLLIAFPGGAGTGSMITTARQYDIPVLRIAGND